MMFPPLSACTALISRTAILHDEARKRKGGEKNGGGAGTRTPDTGIMIPLLYQLSYTAPKSEAYDTGLRLFCQEKVTECENQAA
jgi:hypothetical protein